MPTKYVSSNGTELTEVIDPTQRTALFLGAITTQLDSLASELREAQAPKVIRRVVENLAKNAARARGEVGPDRTDDVAAIYATEEQHIVLVDTTPPLTGSAGPIVFALDVLRHSLTGTSTLSLLHTIHVAATEAAQRGEDVNTAIEKAIAGLGRSLKSAA